MLMDCASYLDGTIYNLEQKVTNFSEDDDFMNMMGHLGQTDMLLGNAGSDPIDEQFVVKCFEQSFSGRLGACSQFLDP